MIMRIMITRFQQDSNKSFRATTIPTREENRTKYTKPTVVVEVLSAVIIIAHNMYVNAVVAGRKTAREK